MLTIQEIDIWDHGINEFGKSDWCSKSYDYRYKFTYSRNYNYQKMRQGVKRELNVIHHEVDESIIDIWDHGINELG